jgi:hypothetical protein
MASPANGLIVKFPVFGWYTYNIVTSSIPTSALTSLDIAPDQSLWMGSGAEGIIHKVGNNFTSFNTANSSITDNAIRCIKVGTDGKVYAGSATEGLFILDPSLLTSLQEINNITNVSVYPNPCVSCDLTVESSIPIEKIELRNMEGRIILQEDSTSNKIVITAKNLNKGVYFLTAYFKNSSMSKKVVIRN